jgi:hypothetical protein
VAGIETAAVVVVVVVLPVVVVPPLYIWDRAAYDPAAGVGTGNRRVAGGGGTLELFVIV